MNIDKNIEKITTRLDVELKNIYQNPIFKPFIDCYFMQSHRSKYKLFGAYIFRFNYLKENYLNKEVKQWYGRNSKLDFRNHRLKGLFHTYINYFIGYTIYGKKNEIRPIFIHLYELEDDNKYDFSGYAIEPSNDEYHYLFEDKKQIGYLKNIDINLNGENTEHPFFELSTKTKNLIEQNN